MRQKEYKCGAHENVPSLFLLIASFAEISFGCYDIFLCQLPYHILPFCWICRGWRSSVGPTRESPCASLN